MANVDIGANSAVWIGMETTYGTPSDPTAVSPGAGVWMPILDEALVYTETKYYSPQIRQQAMVSSVVPAPYHVEGPIHFEVDMNYLPYFLYASRHTVVKTGSGPFTYTVTPTGAGATYPGGAARGMSILVVRNAVGFLYSGCVVSQFSFTINNGILECTASIIGLAEQDPHAAATPTYIDASLFGADASAVYVDTAGLTPTFATQSVVFSGYTMDINHNAEAMNRITPTRAANFIKYGVTDVGVTSDLDFLDKTEYNAFKASTLKAIKLEACKPGGAGTFAAATEALQITNFRSAYDQYTVDTKGMADLVSAAAVLKSLNIAGGTGYKIVGKSSLNLS